MTAPTELLALSGVALVVGFVWVFRKGGPLAKAAMAVVAVYMAAAVWQWSTTDRTIHTVGAGTGVGFVAVMAAGLLVLRYAAWAIPLLMVVGCLVLVGDLGTSIVSGLGR